MHIRLRGAQVHSLQLARPKSITDCASWTLGIVAEVDRLLDNHTDTEVAAALNAAGHQPPVGDRFTVWIIWKIRKAHKLESRFDRLRRPGPAGIGHLQRQGPASLLGAPADGPEQLCPLRQ